MSERTTKWLFSYEKVEERTADVCVNLMLGFDAYLLYPAQLQGLYPHYF